MYKLWKIIILVLLFQLHSCYFFKRDNHNKNAVAKVGDQYLYKEDLPEYFKNIREDRDSLTLISNFINNWAVSQLLMQKAKINLPNRKIREFEQLIDNYRADLYSLGYKEALMKKTLDTVISEEELKKFYQYNKENFKLNEDLIKLRYIELPLNFSKKLAITKKLRTFNKKDSLFLDSISVQFKNYSFSTDIWHKKSTVSKKISIIEKKNKNKILKKPQFIELKDSLTTYLIDIKSVLGQGEVAPISFVVSTIRQILLNKKKMEYIQKLEKDLLKEAIEQKEFEIYETENTSF